MRSLSSRKRQWCEGSAGRCSPFLLRNVLIPSRLQIEGEAVKAFYRNGLMRAPTRAREISFTFTPRRLYRPLWSGDGGADSKVPRRLCTRQAFALRRFLRARGGDSLAQTLTPAPEPMPFAAAVNRAASLTPQSPFPLATPPSCRKGDNVEQKLRFRRGTVGRQWGRGACCAHRDDEGLKWTAVVQVGFH